MRMGLSAADRIALGLDDPPPGQSEQEFLPAMRPTTVDTKPNVRLALKEGEKATAPKIRSLVNELLAGNIQNADTALKQLFALNPKAALELYIELSKFSLPQLKAVAVGIEDNSANPRALTFAQLQQALVGED